MQLSRHLDAAREDLAAVAALADPAHGEVVLRLAGALEAALRLRLLEAVAEAAHELTAQLPGHVEVRLEGGDPSLVYVEAAEAAPPVAGEDAAARITLRLPEALKASVEAAAARDGVSVNSWLVGAIARSVERRPARGNRLTGFARS